MSDYETTCVDTVDAAWSVLRNRQIDLVLLDLGLEKKDGYVLLTDMQNDPAFRDIPVMCVSGRVNLTDKVTAFSLGADDFIAKPFDPIELKSRVSAKLRRCKRQAEATSIRVGAIEIDRARHVVIIDGREAAVTQTEFKLLSALAKRPDHVYSRDQLLVAAWGENANVLERVVDVHLCSLRRKLGAFSHYVRAVPGVGYKLSVQTSQRTPLEIQNVS